MTTTTTATNNAPLNGDSTKPFEKVVVHPLVLLSVVDHFNRMKQVGNTRSVVGVLLGSLRCKVLDISNSFAGNFVFFQHFKNLQLHHIYIFLIIKKFSC